MQPTNAQNSNHIRLTSCLSRIEGADIIIAFNTRDNLSVIRKPAKRQILSLNTD